MDVITGTVKLKFADESKGVFVKNLYLSCDPYMRILMTKRVDNGVFTSFTRDLVRFIHLFLNSNILICLYN